MDGLSGNRVITTFVGWAHVKYSYGGSVGDALEKLQYDKAIQPVILREGMSLWH